MHRALLLGIVLVAGAVRAAEGGQALPGPVAAVGVDEAPRRGTFAEATLGGFFTLGGSRGVSNGQPYLGLIFGRELGEAASIFASVGVGASSGSCFDDATSAGGCLGADSFGMTFLEAGVSYGVPLATRLLLSGKLVAGLTNLSPAPLQDRTARPATVPDNLFGFHGGVGAALDYDTRLDHFAVGIDALARYTFAQKPGGGGSLGIVSIAVMPRLRYVF